MTMSIAFVCGKGGVGKSTLCYLVGLGLKEAGKTVAIEDRDPQKSISSWVDPERDGISIVQPGEQWGGEFRLIDTRPAIDDESVLDAIRTVGGVVMPCSPSPGDVSTVRATIEVVQSLKQPEATASLVLNKVVPGTILSQEAPEMLRELGAPLLTTQLPERQGVQRAVLLGWKALDAKTQGTVLKLALEVLAR